MIVLRVAILSLLALSVSGDTCQRAVKDACGRNTQGLKVSQACNSTTTPFVSNTHISRYVATLLQHNWSYLLLSMHFGSYGKNRKGFSNLFRKMSNECWRDAEEWVKYMALRGIDMDYNVPHLNGDLDFVPNELESLAMALDMQKTLIEELHKVSRESSSNHKEYYDPQTLHLIDNKYLEKYVNTTYYLSGYVNDLHGMLKATDSKNTQDSSLSYYMFDNHLQKVVIKDCQYCVFCIGC